MMLAYKLDLDNVFTGILRELLTAIFSPADRDAYIILRFIGKEQISDQFFFALSFGNLNTYIYSTIHYSMIKEFKE
jgi:hypothetical protein